MVMRPTNYFLHCNRCGRETLQRSLGCEPTVEQLLRAKQDAPKDGLCPKCGGDDFDIRSANNLKGSIHALFKGYL